MNADDLAVDGITASEYLKFKETIFDENWYVLYLYLFVQYILQAAAILS